MPAKLTKDSFIKRATIVHKNKYDYSKIDYINNHTKVIIQCPEHGEFKQTPGNHLQGQGCPKCYKKLNDQNPNYKGGVTKNKLILYETYAPQLEKYQAVYRVEQNGLCLLGVSCIYCGTIFIPNFNSVMGRLGALQKTRGECNFYCSENCKKACPTYRQVSYPKGFKLATSREVQPELRKLVLARDNYTCQKCFKGLNEAQLHCHHIDPIVNNPIESADIDNCIILCKECHLEVHSTEGCAYNELKCKEIL